MKTPVIMLAGRFKGEIGLINGTLETINRNVSRVLVYFPDKNHPACNGVPYPLTKLRAATSMEIQMYAGVELMKATGAFT